MFEEEVVAVPTSTEKGNDLVLAAALLTVLACRLSSQFPKSTLQTLHTATLLFYFVGTLSTSKWLMPDGSVTFTPIQWLAWLAPKVQILTYVGSAGEILLRKPPEKWFWELHVFRPPPGMHIIDLNL